MKDRCWKAKKTQFSIESSILATWAHGEPYLDHQGRPRDLAIEPGPGSFGSLVKEVTGEDSYLQYLDELCESDSVEVNENDTVSLIKRVFFIDKDLSRQLSATLAPLAKTLAYNWTRSRGDGFCSRVAHSGCIDPTKVPALRRMSQDKIISFLEDIDDVLVSSEADNPESIETSDTGVIGVGAYYFEIENDSD